MDALVGNLGTYLPNLLAAVAILVIGWLVAFLVSSAIRAGIQRSPVPALVGRSLGKPGGQSIDIGFWAGTLSFWLIFLFVVVAFFDALRLPVVTEPLNRFLGQILSYVPRLFGAVALLAMAWGIATVLRIIVRRGLTALRIDERIGGRVEGGQSLSMTQTLGDVVYWVVFLVFLPAVLDALELGGLLAPVNSLLSKVMSFVPNLLAAAVIVAVGWFVATLLRQIVSNLSMAVGVNRLADRVGLTTAFGSQRLSGLLGLIVYVMVFIPVILAGLNALQLEALTTPVSSMLNRMLAALPSIFAAVVVLAIAYFVARLAAGLVTSLLTGIGFDSLPRRLGVSRVVIQNGALSRAIGQLVMLGIMLFATLEALRLLEFNGLASLLSQFLVLVGQIVMGVIILGAGLYLANLAGSLLRSAGVPRADLLSAVARVAIIILAGAMALRQMGLANEIINLAFGLLLGAVAVAAGLAFGLGGREQAAHMLEEWRANLRLRNVSSGDD